MAVAENSCGSPELNCWIHQRIKYWGFYNYRATNIMGCVHIWSNQFH